MTQKLHFYLLIFCSIACFSQQDTISLADVHVPDRQLQKFRSKHVETLPDSTLSANRPSLHSLLQYNSAIYLKENGPGMVSSPSFRGSSAQQTAVVWNGINVNSPFNGLTDFNAVNADAFDQVSIRAGGGSTVYGTGAIGGSVHLENVLDFKPENSAFVRSSAGSFETYAQNARVRLSNGSLSAAFAISDVRSENDFEIPGTSRNNVNGKFSNRALSSTIGYRLGTRNTLVLYQYAYDSQRNFSLIFPTDTKTKYRDRHHRALLEWKFTTDNFTSTLKLANIDEAYRYYPNINLSDFDFGNSQTRTIRYEAENRFSNGLSSTVIADFSEATANGSDVRNAVRRTSGASLIVRKTNQKLGYEGSLRVENADFYGSALLYSAGANYTLGKNVLVRGEISRNYRIPTFNDMFWSEGGNSNLEPEYAMQYEFGSDFKYKDVAISGSVFLNKISNMIQWLPGDSQAWFPQNVYSVSAYGAEIHAGLDRKIGKTAIKTKVIYSYTISQDDRTGNQLIYVPVNKLVANISAGRGRFTGLLQTLYTGEVFTRSDNNAAYNIDDYFIANLGADFVLFTDFTAGIRVDNVLNEEYEVVERRPSPGINYSINLTLNIN